MSDLLKCTCPFCSAHLEYPRDLAGTVAQCPGCGFEIEYEPAPDPGPRVVARKFVPPPAPKPKTEPIVRWLAIGAAVVGFGVVVVIYGVRQAFGIAGGMILFLVALSLYFLPSIVARARNHRNCGGVFILNLVFGWTLVGWVASLIWATYQEKT